MLAEALWNRGSALEALLEWTRKPSAPRSETAPRERQYQERLTPVERADVAARYIAGETMGSLASAFGCHRESIRRVLEREGVELWNWRSKVADVSKVVAMYKSGQTAAQIATELGVSSTSVLNHLRGAGVVLRPRGKAPR